MRLVSAAIHEVKKPLELPRIESRNHDFARRKVACVSHKQVPPISSQERVQAPGNGNITLPTPPVEYEFHPDVQAKRRRMQEGARYSTAPYPVCNLQGGNHHEGLQRDGQGENPRGRSKGGSPGRQPGRRRVSSASQRLPMNARKEEVRG